MIEHRMYSIERFVEHARVETAGYMEQKILLCTPSHATMYALQGWTVFDFTELLDMETEQRCEPSQIVLFDS